MHDENKHDTPLSWSKIQGNRFTQSITPEMLNGTVLWKAVSIVGETKQTSDKPLRPFMYDRSYVVSKVAYHLRPLFSAFSYAEIQRIVSEAYKLYKQRDSLGN
jgi:hypothetical protein